MHVHVHVHVHVISVEAAFTEPFITSRQLSETPYIVEADSQNALFHQDSFVECLVSSRQLSAFTENPRTGSLFMKGPGFCDLASPYHLARLPTRSRALKLEL